jgi:hypothetical protein
MARKNKSQEAKQRDADKQLSGEQQPPSQEEQQKKADEQTEGLTHGEGTQTAGDTGAEGAAASGSGDPDQPAGGADQAANGDGNADGNGAGRNAGTDAGGQGPSDDGSSEPVKGDDEGDALTCLACGKPIAEDAPSYPDVSGTLCGLCAPRYGDLLIEEAAFFDLATGDPLTMDARRKIYDAHIAAGGDHEDSMASADPPAETDEERAERERQEFMRTVSPNVAAAALAASAAFGTVTSTAALDRSWIVPGDGPTPSYPHRATVAAAFVRDNPDAPDAALPVHLSMKGFGDIEREPGRRVLAAWKVFRATLNALDQVTREDAAEAEREARRKNPDAPSAGFGGDLAMTPSRLPMQPTGFSTVDD